MAVPSAPASGVVPRLRTSGAARIGPLPARLLPIYLNDHLLGATVGVELARRTQRENVGTALGDFLLELLGEIEADRATLESLIERLGLRPSRTKRAVGWAAEKAGRLKLNGQVTGYSPLSRLAELDGLAGGIETKRALWLALAPQARSQRERLEPYRLAAAREAF